MAQINIEHARAVLKDCFPFTEKKTTHIITYRTKTGRELALEPNSKDAYLLWLQKYNTAIEGVEINNRDYPGLPYEAKQTRNHHLNETNSPKLKLGNKVWYLKIRDLEALKHCVDWYAKI
jgi:hypothetical protein